MLYLWLWKECHGMPVRHGRITSWLGFVFAGLLSAVFLLFITRGAQLTAAQEAKGKEETAKTSSNASLVARGKYIVEGVAHCGDCHTPRDANGEPDTARWLVGGPVVYLPARPDPNWPLLEPRIAGTPPASDAAMITLFMTGIWVDGKPLRWPMPRFQMTRSDAEAVLAYLKSLNPGR
jgi:mono/diheme cytochrome c family protein